MLRLTFLLSAIYLLLVGLGLMLVPLQFGIGAVPADAPPALIALLRLLGGPFLGIAVLNWLCRNAGPSAERRAVVIANLVGFGAVAINDIVGVSSGEARDLARLFLIVHLGFAAAFARLLRRG